MSRKTPNPKVKPASLLGGGVTRVSTRGSVFERSRSIKDIDHMRLVYLLNEMVEKLGNDGVCKKV